MMHLLLPFFLLLLSFPCTSVRLLAAGPGVTCAVLRDNSTKCFGWGPYLGKGSTFNIGNSNLDMGTSLPSINWRSGDAAPTQLSVGGSPDGYAAICAVLESASSGTRIVRCFGANNFGMLGLGKFASAPNLIVGDEAADMNAGNWSAVNLGTGLYPHEISVGYTHVCVIVSNSTIARMAKCWGSNSNGQLGNANYPSGATVGTTPASMGDGLLFMNFSAPIFSISCGNAVTCFVSDPTSITEGDVYCTGEYGTTFGSVGKNGQGDSAADIFFPKKVNLGARKFAKVSVKNGHVCALVAFTNGVVCWGSAYGNGNQAATDIKTSAELLTLAPLALDAAATDIVTGTVHACARLVTGLVQCWGDNGQASPGLGSSATRFPESTSSFADLVPVNLGASGTATAKFMAAGWTQTCVIIDANDAVKCWGTSSKGELGLGLGMVTIGLSLSEMGDSLPTLDLADATLAPTLAPSSAPTVAPTLAPSIAPTRAPTLFPSVAPTVAPTAAPTTAPTIAPSNAPITLTPTLVPSLVPTLTPTAPTTRTPSRSPSHRPTTRVPTISQAAANEQLTSTIGIAVGASVGAILALSFAVFLIRRVKDDSNAGGANRWLAQVDFNQTPTPKFQGQADPQINIGARVPMGMDVPNPRYVNRTSSEYSSTSSPAQNQSAGGIAKPTKDQMFAKLRAFYAKIEPGKNIKDVEDVAYWASLQANPEAAMNAKLLAKYKIDLSSVESRSNLSFLKEEPKF